MKAKHLFITDLLLLVSLAPASTSGFLLHWAGHQDQHEVWHNWAVVHIFSTLIFTIIVGVHIYAHYRWYKSILKNGWQKKSKPTILLTLLMLLLVTTGNIILLKHQGANTDLGIKHYILGIGFTALCIGHLIKRAKRLIKGLKG